MIYRTEGKTVIPPVRGSLSGKQVRGTCADQFGTKKNFYLSAEVAGVIHCEFPSDDGYKNINIEALELFDALEKLLGVNLHE